MYTPSLPLSVYVNLIFNCLNYHTVILKNNDITKIKKKNNRIVIVHFRIQANVLSRMKRIISCIVKNENI